MSGTCLRFERDVCQTVSVSRHSRRLSLKLGYSKASNGTIKHSGYTIVLGQSVSVREYRSSMKGNTLYQSTLIRHLDLLADLTELQKKCKQRPLEDNYLEVCALDPVKCLVLSADEDITIEELKEYFKIRAKSGGGKVQRISLRQDGCFTVKFKHEKGKIKLSNEKPHQNRQSFDKFIESLVFL